MTFGLEPSSHPQPNLVLKTSFGVKEELLLFPHFLLITCGFLSFLSFFFNCKFKRLFSRLHPNILGRNGDVRCLFSPRPPSVLTLCLSWHFLQGLWSTRLCWGLNRGQRWTSFNPRRRRQRRWPPVWEQLSWGTGVSRIGRHFHSRAPFPASVPSSGFN